MAALDSRAAPDHEFIDLAFGTFYMPAGRQPQRFGTLRDDVPDGVVRQLLYPFSRKTSGRRVVIDEILSGIGEVLFRNRGQSKRAQLLARLFFGLLGAFLGIAGVVHFLTRPRFTNNSLFNASIVAMFVALACFFLFNVALARSWRWPGLLFVVSFVGMIVTRLAFGV